MTNGGVDYSFECAGNLDVLREAFHSTHDVCIFYLFSFSVALILFEINFFFLHFTRDGG
jgi:Zn-dependent alcohol dehydrogenase